MRKLSDCRLSPLSIGGLAFLATFLLFVRASADGVGGGIGATVKAASTAAVAGDRSLVVQLSPNSPTNATPQSGSAFAPSAYDLSATAATNIKASGGNVYGWFGNNPNASTCFLQFYNSSSPSLGTSALHPFGIPTGASWNVAPGGLALFNLSTAISTGQTTTATGSSQCASAMTLTILYD